MSRTDLNEFLASRLQGSSSERKELVTALLQESRRMSTRTVVFHAAIADRLGLNPSDHKCADLICNETGPITAGRLAEITGLSTGAITGVVDRLERAGFVSRVADSEDRRRVVIQGTEGRAPDMRHLFQPMMEGMVRLCESYTDEQLALIVGFMRQSGEVAEGQILRLRQTAESAGDADSNPEKPRKSRAKSAPGRAPSHKA